MLLWRLVMFVSGAIIFAITVHDIFFTPSTEQIRHQRQEFAHWPAVKGEIDELFYQREHNYAKGERWWFVVARYRYRVDGVAYSGTRYAPERVRDTSTVGLDQQVAQAGIAVGRNVVERVPGMETVPHLPMAEPTPRETLRLADKRVLVYYNPVNPAESFLDNRYREPWSAGRSAFFYFLGIAVSLWIMYLAVFGIPNLMARRALRHAPRAGQRPAYAPLSRGEIERFQQGVSGNGQDGGIDEEKRLPRPELPPIEFELQPEIRPAPPPPEWQAGAHPESPEVQERQRLAEAAHDIADRYRAGRLPDLAGLPWELASDRLAAMLRSRCPGFTTAEYEKVLGDGFLASR